MKKILVFVLLALSTIFGYADIVEYDSVTASCFQKQLVSKAVEVSKIFGPEYQVENAKLIQINGPMKLLDKYSGRPDLDNWVGKEYYEITFYNPSMKIEGNYLAKVSIWTDGEPKMIYFGGYVCGLDFTGSTVEEVRMRGLE